MACDPLPFTIVGWTPFTVQGFAMVRYLGLRHLIVCNKYREAVGMITRKNLLEHHLVSSEKAYHDALEAAAPPPDEFDPGLLLDAPGITGRVRQ